MNHPLPLRSTSRVTAPGSARIAYSPSHPAQARIFLLRRQSPGHLVLAATL
uniref:Uncharacterized protein MANES_02G038400 n=1 Tax=Rhizophora mucronata TaxID=61149 RepID=A0A2P2N0S7_RHIMU